MLSHKKRNTFFSKYYVLLFLLLFLFYVIIPTLAPVLMHEGHELPARIIYTVYSKLCHGLPYRCFFLYGPQYYYPSDRDGDQWDVKTFEEIAPEYSGRISLTGSFIGSDKVGYKIPLCQRDLAIFSGLCLFSILFMLFRGKIPGFHWTIWLLIGVLPMALDGFSQAFGGIFPALLPIRESTPFLRILTGGLFGFVTGWFLLPFLEKSLEK